MSAHSDTMTIEEKLAYAIILCWELLDPAILGRLARTIPDRVRTVIGREGVV